MSKQTLIAEFNRLKPIVAKYLKLVEDLMEEEGLFEDGADVADASKKLNVYTYIYEIFQVALDRVKLKLIKEHGEKMRVLWR